MLKILAIAVTLSGLTACSNERDLGNGYRQVWLSGTTTAIIDRHNNFVVYPNVVDLRTKDRFVTGRRVLAEDNIDSTDRRFTEGLGPFRLDLQTGEVAQVTNRASGR